MVLCNIRQRTSAKRGDDTRQKMKLQTKKKIKVQQKLNQFIQKGIIGLIIYFIK